MPSFISSLAHSGMANDYTSLNINHYTIVGLKRALYCLGLRDHSLISCLEFGLLGIVSFIRKCFRAALYDMVCIVVPSPIIFSHGAKKPTESI